MTAQEFLIEKYLIKFGEKLVDYIPRIPKETNYYAVLVEPRLNHKILYILKNHMYFLNESESNIKWGLQIFHGINNEDQIKHITKDWLNVEYVNMEVDNFTKITFNQYIKNPNFWKKITRSAPLGLLMYDISAFASDWTIDSHLTHYLPSKMLVF